MKERMHLCNAWKLLPALAAACSAQGLLADRPLELVGRGGQAEVYKTTLPIAVKVVRGSNQDKVRNKVTQCFLHQHLQLGAIPGLLKPLCLHASPALVRRGSAQTWT